MEEEFMRLRINTTKSTSYFEFNNNIYRVISITRSSFNFIETVYAKTCVDKQSDEQFDGFLRYFWKYFFL